MRRFPGLRVAAVHDVPRLDSRYRDEQGRRGVARLGFMGSSLPSTCCCLATCTADHWRHLTRVAMEASPCLQVFSDEPWHLGGNCKDRQGKHRCRCPVQLLRYVANFARRIDVGTSWSDTSSETGIQMCIAWLVELCLPMCGNAFVAAPLHRCTTVANLALAVLFHCL